MGTVALIAGLSVIAVAVVVLLSDAFLKYRRRRALDWARRMSQSQGSQAYDIWVEDMKKRAAEGILDEDIASICVESGLELPEAEPEKPKMLAPPKHQVTWDFKGHYAMKALLIALGTVAGAIAGFALSCGIGVDLWLYAAWFLVGTAVAAFLCICDIQARILPWTAALALAVAGLVFQFIAFGVQSLLITLIVGVVVYTLMKLLARKAPRGAIGAGDVRVIAAICVYLGISPIAGVLPIAIGALLAALASVIVLAVMFAAQRIRRGSLVPLGPALSAWIVIGAISPVLSVCGI